MDATHDREHLTPREWRPPLLVTLSVGGSDGPAPKEFLPTETNTFPYALPYGPS